MGSMGFTENGSLRWNNRKPGEIHPRKLTCPLKRDYLSIGNTSSNHRFSGGHVSFPGSNQSQNSFLFYSKCLFPKDPFICPKNLVFPLYSNDLGRWDFETKSILQIFERGLDS